MEIDGHAIRNMFFQRILGLSLKIGDGGPHDVIDKDKVDASLSRPGGSVMLVTGSAIIRRVGL
eukprot:10180482-Karenia_brevis.AAC.1